MPYTTDTNNKILEFMNRAQTKIGLISTTIASKVGRGARRGGYAQDADMAYMLDSFLRSLDSQFNTWTEAEIVQMIEMWTARANLSGLPYFTHTAYNLNILTRRSSDFTVDANLNMNGFKIINVADGVSSGDAINKSQLDVGLNAKVAKSGDTMSGNLAMGGFKVTGLAGSTANGEAVRHEQIANFLLTTGDDMTGTLAMNANRILDLGAASLGSDAIRKDQVDAGLALKVAKAGDTMGGNLAMGGNKVTGLGAASSAGDALPHGQAAGGQLSGTYPNPSLATGAAVTNIGYTPENVANKDTDTTMAANSDTKYPSQKAVKTYIDNLTLLKTVVSIGDWDMDTNASVAVAHGISSNAKTRIRFVQVEIFDDDDVLGTRLLDSWDSSFTAVRGTVESWDATNVYLYRKGGTGSAGFDNTSYNATGFNRGKVSILYDP